ncbi:MAG: hypothetical protein NVS9B1_16740 [Candidatus Dormibacteraceae bacterium]
MAKRIASGLKQARQSIVRAARNKSVRSAVKTRVIKVRKAVAEHGENLAEVTTAAIASLDRAAGKGVLHANNAARRKSRLMKAMNGAGATPAAHATPAKVAKPAAAKAVAKPSARPAPKAPAKAAAAKAAAAKKPAAKKAAAKPAAKPAAKKPAAPKKK